MKGIARLVGTKSGDIQAQLLLENQTKPIDFLFRGSCVEVADKLAETYPNVSIVRNQEFLCELDHIDLFKCRSDAPSWSFS